MRQNYADLIHKCGVDDDVKVVVIRGEGEDFGSGGDLPEQRDMLENPGMPLLHELAINDDDVKYPPGGSYRYLSTVTDFYAKALAGCRPLQELRKISIIEAKGYCYGWHFYQAGDADLVISSEDALFGHPAFRYVGWGPRLWWWAETMGLRKFSEMLFTGRPFAAREMYECGFVNSVVPREKLEEETLKYAMACSRSRPTDTVAVQKTFLELYKQHKGEYFGSLLTGMIEGMLPPKRPGKRGRPDRGSLRHGAEQRRQGQRSEFPAGVAAQPLGPPETLTDPCRHWRGQISRVRPADGPAVNTCGPSSRMWTTSRLNTAPTPYCHT
jgi:enoyl-CoA hydratase